MSDKMVKVLKDFVVITNPWFYAEKKLIRKDSILCLRRILTNNGFDKYYCEDLGFEIQDLKTMIKMEFVEEILPDKKPISLEENTNIEEDIYSKKYNIYEILTLIPNLPNDSNFKCSLDKDDLKWSFDEYYEDFRRLNFYDEEQSMSDVYTLKRILEATYTIVKPIEEVEESWIEIETLEQLISTMIKGKGIKIGNDRHASNGKYDGNIGYFLGHFNQKREKMYYLDEGSTI